MSGGVDPARLYAAHDAAVEYYRAQLPHSLRGQTYLRSRGITGATAHQPPWRLGYAGPGWTGLRDHLRHAGFTDTELLATGLVTTSRAGAVIDVFRNRVMFPVRDHHGRVVAFTGRDTSGRTDTPKWRNSPGTAIYHKKDVLYGLAEQLTGDTQPTAVMLVEGPADVLAMARLRDKLPADVYPQQYHAVAPCGTALTAEQVVLLADTVPPGTPLVVAFDADNAGAGAADKAHELLRDWSGPVDAVALPAGDDPASLVALHVPLAAAEILAAVRTPLAELVFEHRLAPWLARIQDRQAEIARLGLDRPFDTMPISVGALHAVAPLLAEVADRDPARAARLIVDLATRLDLEPLTVHEAIYPVPDDDADLATAGLDATPDRGDGQLTAADRPLLSHAAHLVVADQRGATSRLQRALHIGFQRARRLMDHLQHLGVVGPADGSKPRPVLVDSNQLSAILADINPADDAASDGTIADTRFPAPEVVGHDYAHINPDTTATAVWVQHDPDTGHTAWVLAEGVANTPGDRVAARLAAEVGGRVGVLVGARHAVEIARTALNEHFAGRATGPQGDATIAVLTTFDGDRPIPGRGRFTVAWAGDTRAYGRYGTNGAIFAPLTVDHTVGAQATARRPRPGDGALTATVRGGPIGTNRIDLPLTEVVLAGRSLNTIPAGRVAEAVYRRHAADGVRRLSQLPAALLANAVHGASTPDAISRLGPATPASPAAVVVRPRGGQHTVTPAQLARQDQAAPAAHGVVAVPAPRRADANVGAAHTATAATRPRSR